MNKLEKERRLESLTDIQRIRLEVGKIHDTIAVMGFLTLGLIFLILSIIFIRLNDIITSLFCSIGGVFFIFFEVLFIHISNRKEERFLLKYGF